MPIAETIAGLKVLSQGLKSLGEIGETINNAKVKELTSEMLDKVISLQHELLAYDLKNAELKTQVRILNEQLQLLNEKFIESGDFVFNRNSYWKTKDGQQVDGPYCANCGKKDPQRLVDKFARINGEDNYKCPKCKQTYWIE
jgi:predicted SprT family Zn-dependent metalloprotease